MVATPVVQLLGLEGQLLGLEGQPIPQQKLSFAVAGNDCPNMQATLHQLPLLELDKLRVQGLHSLQFASTVIPAELSGVLGMDVLQQFDLYLHPGRSTLSLLPPTSLPEDEIAAAVPLEQKLGVMVAQLYINGKGPFRVLLDTTAENTFISEQVAARLKLDADTLSPIQIRGFCGLEDAIAPQIRHSLSSSTARSGGDYFVSQHPQSAGILGQSFLRHYQQYWRCDPASAAGSLLWVPLTPSASHPWGW